MVTLPINNRTIIVENIPDFEKGEVVAKEGSDSEAKRKARERQAAILAQFATQQKAFLKVPTPPKNF
jgi:hypothetical protein